MFEDTVIADGIGVGFCLNGVSIGDVEMEEGMSEDAKIGHRWSLGCQFGLEGFTGRNRQGVGRKSEDQTESI